MLELKGFCLTWKEPNGCPARQMPAKFPGAQSGFPSFSGAGEVLCYFPRAVL
ncbi:hypothetical protein [Hymenobacter terricola]|uniref:hypothetical protein n=1 Tax=Hymenobacter terricola TaxID=2819236 RepID=UPI001B30AAA5|nr:hypothetical protein [Hymenobacter terricola]